MNIFNKSYRFYQAGAPYPGVCLACSNVNNLWDLGIISGTNRGAYLCDVCLQDLALFSGFVLKAAHEKTVNELNEKVKNLNSQVAAAPNLMKELTDGINNLLSEFVVGLASVTSASKPVQPKSDKADTGSSKQLPRPAKKSSPRSAEDYKPSSKSSEH
jgi:hypothetical protein